MQPDQGEGRPADQHPDSQKGNGVALTFWNAYAVCPRITDGLSAAAKEGKKNHGELNCRVEGEEFVLTLMCMKTE